LNARGARRRIAGPAWGRPFPIPRRARQEAAVKLVPKPFAKPLAIVLSLGIVYALFGFFAAPALIKRGITGYAAEPLQRRASVGEVHVNPLLLKLELKDFALAERDGRLIVGFKRLLVDFDVSSLARWAWTFSEIALEGLDLRVDIGPDGVLNLAVLLERIPKTERRPGERPPRVLLRHVVLSGGAIAFSDRSDPTPASTALQPINLELRDISTLPDHRGPYSVSARLADGGLLNWRGEVSLDPLSSHGEVNVKGVKPLTAWRFLQDELALAEPRGEFDFSARYRVAYARGAPQAVLENIQLAGRGIALTATGTTEPMLALSTIAATGGRFDLAAREIVVPSVEVRGGAVVADVDRGGTINWEKLVKARAARRTPEPDTGSSPRPWKAKVESLKVAGISLRHTDRSRAKPIRIVAKEVAVELAATVETRPGGTQVLLEGITLALTNPAVSEPDAAEPLVVFDSIALDGGTVNLDDSRAGIGRVAVTGGSVRVVRDKTGALPILGFLGGADAGRVRRELAGALQHAKKEGRPWSVALDALEVNGTRIAFSDQSFGEPVAYDVQDLRVRLNGIRSDGRKPVKFNVAMRLAQGGAFTANGDFNVAGDRINARAKLDRINLKPLQPALFSRVRAVLVSGELSADLNADYRARGGRHGLGATGAARIDNLLLNDAEGGERMIAWSSLAANGISLSLAPDDLKVDEARIAGLDSRIVVYKDRSVNLVNVITVDPGRTGGDAGSTAAPVTIGELEARFPVTVGRVLIEKGAVDFADLSLVLPFAAKVEEVEGVIQGVSTDRASRASVRLEGRVGEFGLARVNGSLRPFRPKSFLDLNVVFRNVQMPPLSPYSATFAGRRIASGRLALDLHYKIDNGTLAGDNRVVLEKFTLGERVEAPGAVSLPLDLAIALLTDSDGKIDLAMPVHGNVDDPQFSYGHLVWQAITTLLTRIVTAPFRALGALFGGGGERLESIAFDPGRTTLLPPEREKLKRVADGLARRPQLRLVAEGQYGPADRAALQQRDVALAVAARLGRPPAGGDSPEPVNVTDAKTQRALEGLFIERQSDQALSQFEAETGKSRGKEVQRVNAALALIGRGSADREFYEALLKRLSDTAQVPDAALAQLAGERARAVTGHLSTALAVPPARTEARTAAAPGSAQVRLVLDAARAAAPEKAGGKE
jgi:uncharacterized protein involved in outer membrane biogenesis